MKVFVAGRSIIAGGGLVREPVAKTPQVLSDAAVKRIKGHTLDVLIGAAHRSVLTP